MRSHCPINCSGFPGERRAPANARVGQPAAHACVALRPCGLPIRRFCCPLLECFMDDPYPSPRPLRTPSRPPLRNSMKVNLRRSPIYPVAESVVRHARHPPNARGGWPIGISEPRACPPLSLSLPLLDVPSVSRVSREFDAVTAGKGRCVVLSIIGEK